MRERPAAWQDPGQGRSARPAGRAGLPPAGRAGGIDVGSWEPRSGWRRRRRRAAAFLAAALLLLLAALVALDLRLHRTDALAGYQGRPARTPGQDWLVVGSDSRVGLSEAQKRELATGDAAGRRADTIMLLHVPGRGGQAVLVSLPRDSYVPIPGRGWNKLNAAYAFGGPRLLAQTVERVTGIRLDHYLEVGFGGFDSIVDAVGGVSLCIEEPMRDRNAGLNLKAGCQVLDGAEALGYVRSRASARGDLDRVQRQQRFLAALMAKAASPGVLLNPARSVPLARSVTGSVTVASGDRLHHLARLAFTLRAIGQGDGVATTVPISRSEHVPGAGSVLRWDRERALALFGALKADRPPGAATG